MEKEEGARKMDDTRLTKIRAKLAEPRAGLIREGDADRRYLMDCLLAMQAENARLRDALAQVARMKTIKGARAIVEAAL